PTASGTSTEKLPSSAGVAVATGVPSTDTVTGHGHCDVPVTVTDSATVAGTACRTGAAGGSSCASRAHSIALTSSRPPSTVQPRPGPTASVTALADSSTSMLPALRQSHPAARPVTAPPSAATCRSASGRPAYRARTL